MIKKRSMVKVKEQSSNKISKFDLKEIVRELMFEKDAIEQIKKKYQGNSYLFSYSCKVRSAGQSSLAMALPKSKADEFKIKIGDMILITVIGTYELKSKKRS